MTNNLDSTLQKYGINIGLSNEKSYAGTWEWFERKTRTYKTGFMTIAEAYSSAAMYLNNEYGINTPVLND